ncbi:MAG: DUF551 domain-containing protein [Bacteroidales bacterium]|nr:DUF551 domain-containing protein [Bacteroidales bacterium]
MKEFVEKLIGRLEEKKDSVPVNRLLDDIIKDKPKELGQLMAYDNAIEIVNQLAEEYEEKDCSKCSRRSWYQKGYADAEKNNGWIPVSERLPEESELVLIYAESRARGGSIRIVGHLHNGFWFAQTSSDTLGLTGIGQFDVIAWMELPEKYKEKNNGSS